LARRESVADAADGDIAQVLKAEFYPKLGDGPQYRNRSELLEGVGTSGDDTLKGDQPALCADAR